MRFIVGMMICVVFATDAVADQARLYAEEAQRIEIARDHNGVEFVKVSGCERCPLNLALEPATIFEIRQKRISREQARQMSGKPGTVGHRDGVAVDIRW